MGMEIENNICEAIEYIVNNAVANANYDKTIQATIVKCIDATIGKYKIKYQNSTFFAFAQDISVSYINGSDVYILVPGNDMSRDKVILGTVKKLGSNYIDTSEEDEKFETIGKNCIESTNNFELCSYESNKVEIIYDKNSSDNKITLNKTAVETYIKKSSSLLCGATIRTALPTEQQFRGNYGVVFELNFLDNASENIVTKNYVLDINQMVGNPYRITLDSRQYGLFQIDTNNFVDINRIYLFVYDFPNRANNKPADIFIKNLELCGMTPLTDEELASCALTFITPKGTFFDDNDLDSDTREIQAQVRVKGKIVDKDSQQLKYYWFVEDIRTTTISEHFNKYGGAGWRCLNPGNVVKPREDTIAPVIEWVPGDYNYIIKKSDSAAKETKYKCVVLYGDIIVSKEISIINYSSNYDLTISSDAGTKFYFDIGTPTLTCMINNAIKADENFTYAWAMIDNNNHFNTLSETTEENKIYNDAAAGYNALLSQVKNEAAMPAASQEKLNEYLTIMEKYDKIMRVEKNRLVKVQIREITNFATYKCAVYYKETYIGTASIALTNSLDAEGVYTLVINNGSQVFKYDENGISPTSNTSENPYVIPPLSFTVYDNLGQEISQEVLAKSKFKWIAPKENTMLEISSNYTPDTGTENEYSQLFTFVYNISQKYFVSKTNNNIQLELDYKGMHLTATTNFTFAKEGDPGTNGTDFLCRIVPNVAIGNGPLYPMLLNGQLNYTPRESGKWFKVELWHSGELIFGGTQSGNTTEGKQADVVWSILRNKYSSQIYDNTDLSVESGTGKCSYSGYNENSAPANIIKCSITYDGVIYYATMPLITAQTNENYQVQLEDYSGFRFATYSADGRRAKYDNANPFNLIVKQKINNVWEDITTSEKYKCTFNWNKRGKIYNPVDKVWELSLNLDFKDRKQVDTNSNPTIGITNPIWIKPNDEYTNECVNNAMECKIYQGSTKIGVIHIPIHLLLNKYGQAALNQWDGNHIEINEEGGFILAPQIGAGQKEKDSNTFTGILMGKVKEANQKQADIGLIGYHRGIRTLHIDSEGGYAIFGKNGPGQIILDPTSSKGMIYSNNFWADYYDDNSDTSKNGLPKTNYSYSNNKYNGQKNTSNSKTQEDTNSGMLIDLTSPRILWGNGNFRVDPDGFLYARGGGEIAGWKIDSYKIHSADGNSRTALGKTGMSSVYNENGEGVTLKSFKLVNDNSDGYNNVNKAAAFWAGTNKFIVAHDGYLKCESATIGSGTKPIFITKSSSDGNQSAIYSGKKSSFGSNASGFYIGTDGIALGTHNSNGESKFQVTSNGELTAREGSIGGWTITRNEIKGGNVTLNSNGNIDCTGGNGWYIHSDGSARFGNMSIGSNGDITANGGTFNNITAQGGTFNDITANRGSFTDITVTRGSFNDITANGGTFNNITASGGTFSSINVTGSAKLPASCITGLIKNNQLDSISAGKITSGTMSANRISGGTLNITTAGGGYVKAGAETTHLDVSGINMGDAGLKMQGHEVSDCGTINMRGGSQITSSGGLEFSTGGVTFTGGATTDTLTVTGASTFGSVKLTSGLNAGGDTGQTCNIKGSVIVGQNDITLKFKWGILIEASGNWVG